MTDPKHFLSRRHLLAASTLAGFAPVLVTTGLMTADQARAQGIAPKKGGTLNSLLTPEPPVLIMGVNNQGPTLVVISKIYQSLLEFSPTLEPKPLLAIFFYVSEYK